MKVANWRNKAVKYVVNWYRKAPTIIPVIPEIKALWKSWTPSEEQLKNVSPNYRTPFEMPQIRPRDIMNVLEELQ